MNQQFTDEELSRAAKKVRESMLSSLPDPSSCDHEFPSDFLRHMNRILDKSRFRKKLFQYAQRAVAVFVAAVISVSVWLAIDVSARAAFFKWVRETYEQSFVYKFFGTEPRESLPFFSPTWLPGGYIQSRTMDGFSMRNVVFTNEKDFIYLRYCYKFEGAQDEILTSTVLPVPVVVNGHNGDYYEADTDGEANELIWVDEEQNIVFGISGQFDKDILLKIAQSVKST